jgi:GTP-binding protein
MNKPSQARPPLVAIVGRPNVGKSTLFNRLAGQRIALVDDVPGVTRDRNYALMSWRGQAWNIIDTGGFEPETEDDILRHMRTQTEIAIAEADAIIFLLDGKDGVTPSDHEVENVLRRAHKPVLHAVNKVDGPRHEDKLGDFYELGVDKLYGVSAEHGYGVDDLLDGLMEFLPGAPESGLEDEDGEAETRVAVVGKPNVGKSTLINSLLGEERLLVHDKPGTTRDAVDSELVLNGKKFLFVDTAGMRRKSRIDTRLERFSVMRSLRSLERCHIALLLIDAREGVVDQDQKIAELAADRGRAMILIFNKWDLVPDKEKRREELDEQVRERLPHVSYAPVLTISALEKKRVGKIAAMIETVMIEYNKRIGTGELNRWLEKSLADNPPPTPQGKLIRIYYATQTGVRPPSFVFFVNRSDRVPQHYKRYLANRLRESFQFIGSPLRLRFKPRKKTQKSFS